LVAPKSHGFKSQAAQNIKKQKNQNPFFDGFNPEQQPKLPAKILNMISVDRNFGFCQKIQNLYRSFG
jgi:hypothetical protein